MDINEGTVTAKEHFQTGSLSIKYFFFFYSADNGNKIRN